MKRKTLKSSLASAPGRLAMAPSADSWRAGKTTTSRGYGYKWQQARLRFLTANPLCVMCDAKGLTVAADVVDHRVAHRGDERIFWDRSGWQSMCVECHNRKREAEEAAATPRGGSPNV
jgi:5-methylcytosine-specific restriction protein A